MPDAGSVSRRGAQEAHEAIRPTYISRRTISGTPQEQKLYDLVWKRAVASQMSDAALEKTNVDINMAGTPADSEALFRAEGETLKFEGFMRAYGIETSDDPSDNDPQADVLLQGPSRYTEPTLVKKMEDLDIGRPSTYASTVSTIQARGYVEHGDNEGTPREYHKLTLSKDKVSDQVLTENTGSNRGKLVPTDVGMIVNDFLAEYFPEIMDYNFTAKVEERFDDIAQGKLPWQEEINEFYGSFHPLIDKVNSMRSETKVRARFLGTDPATGKRVSAKVGRFGPVIQIGEATDDEKPRFASLQEGQSLGTITLEEALKLFDLPRQLGTFEEKPVSAAIGRFGPYMHFDKMFASIPKDMSPHTITLDEAIALIREKREKEANKLIKTFDELPGVEVLNGRFGPYIAFKKPGDRKATNYKIPKGTDPKALTVEEVNKLMADQDASPKPAKRTTRKKS